MWRNAFSKSLMIRSEFFPRDWIPETASEILLKVIVP